MSHKPHTYHDESPYNNTEQDLSRCNKYTGLMPGVLHVNV